MPGLDPDQPRDEKGQWTDTGAGAAIKKAASDKKVVTNAADATKALKEMIEQKIIDDDLVAAVSSYTGSDYIDINQPLRKGLAPEETPHGRTIKELDKFLEIAPKFEGVTYRGIRFTTDSAFESFMSDVENGAIIEDEAFGSTTIERSNVKIFAHSGVAKYSVEMIIKGRSGVYVDPISSMSTELEVLYPRRTKFKVNNVKVEDATNEYSLKKKAVIELEEVN